MKALTFNHNVDGVCQLRWSVMLSLRKDDLYGTIIFHLQCCRCVIFVYSVTIIKEAGKLNMRGLTDEANSTRSVPNGAHVLANFVRVSALELHELGVTLNLEEHLFSCLSYNLDDIDCVSVVARGSSKSKSIHTFTLIGAFASSALTSA
jgi:hypothetical protein